MRRRMMLLATALAALCVATTAGAQEARGAELDAAGRRYSPAVRHCYQERGLKEDPALRGLLRVGGLVAPAGRLLHPVVTASRVHGLGMESVVSCVRTAVASWHFTEGALPPRRVELLFALAPEGE